MSNENEVQLKLADIRNAIQVIDYSCEQGVYRSWQSINDVWQLRQRLVAFVEAHMTPEEREELAKAKTVSTEKDSQPNG